MTDSNLWYLERLDSCKSEPLFQQPSSCSLSLALRQRADFIPIPIMLLCPSLGSGITSDGRWAKWVQSSDGEDGLSSRDGGVPWVPGFAAQ